MTTKENERFAKLIYIIEKLDKKILNGRYERFNWKNQGIRSRQVAALIELLIEKGILE